MSSELQIFNYNTHEVRTVNKDGDVWFIAKDVCDILELSNSRMAIQELDDDEKGVSTIYTLGGNQEMNIISEAGVYALIFKSRKPEAKQFNRWVRHELLPQVVRTGSYGEKSHMTHEELNCKRAEFLQNIINASYIPENSKAVISHEIFKIITGHECLLMLPEAKEARYTATELGKMFGVSANKIGRIAKKYGLKSKQGEPSEYGTWICDKSRYSNHECLTFVYNDKAIAWFKEHRDLLYEKGGENHGSLRCKSRNSRKATKIVN